jgi:hypothetical protein
MTLNEHKILVCTALLNSGSHSHQKLGCLMALVEAKDLLIDTAVREGMACLLYKGLVRSGSLDSLDGRHREKLQGLYYMTVRANLKRLLDLKEILNLAHREGVEVVLLQGMILLHQVYEDIGLRAMSDIDLWVPRKDHSRFVAILDSLGYKSDSLYPKTFTRGPTILDVHQHLFWADRIKAREMFMQVTQENIHRETQVIEFEGEKARCLSKYDQVLYLGLHALKHNVGRLIWLVDIKNLVVDWEEEDWKALVKRAGEMGRKKTVTYIFYLLYHLMEFEPPSEIRRLLGSEHLGLVEKWILKRRIRKGSLPVWAPLVLFVPEQGWRRRLFYILETAFPRPEILRQVFPHHPRAKDWQLYPMRVAQLVEGMILSFLRKGLS